MKAAVAISLAMSLAAGAAQAGRSCENKAPDAANVQRAMTLAEHTARALDASGAQVVVLARAGQDLSKYGLAWSHLGLAYKDGARWRVVHKLNACGSARADVYRQGLGEFFLDDLWRYEAVWAVPTPEVQQRLLPVLEDGARARALQHAPYSMVSYAWAGFGAAFGPVIILSLWWERMTRAGALAGIVTGAVTVLVWKQFGWLGLYEIVPGFILGWLATVVVSPLGPAPSATMSTAHVAVQREFERIGAH